MKLENEILCRILQVSSEQAIEPLSNTGGHPDAHEFGTGGKGEPVNVRGDFTTLLTIITLSSNFN